MTKIAYVILHYLTADETIACIDSLLSHALAEQDAIIIVDNHSGNGSIEQVERHFAAQNCLHVLKLDQNLGFARGNNAGFQYAKQQLQADFIVLLNNDTEINQPNFRDQLLESYRQDPFDVLGPDIVTLDGQHQNPKALAGYNTAALNQKIARVRRDLFLNRTRLYQLLIWLDRRKSSARPEKGEGGRPATPPPAKARNVVLHGSCLIFAPDYVRRYNGLFSQTFLYCEEEILWQIAQVEKLRLVYQPALQILHKEDRSTKASHRSTIQRRTFKLTHELHSLQALHALISDPEIYRRDLIDPSQGSTGGQHVSN